MSTLGDQEQLDGLKSFAQKYGSAVFSGILIALIAYFGWTYWQNKKLATAQIETAKVQQLMDDASSLQGKDAFTALSNSADLIVKEAPDSVQALQTQLLMAKLAYDKQDYAGAEKALEKVAQSKLDDQGLMHILKLRLADAQAAQKKYDQALKTLEPLNNASFKAVIEEARGDIYVAKNQRENAQKAYQSAWDDLQERQEERQILQIKLESVGILVDNPDVERPVLQTQMDES